MRRSLKTNSRDSRSDLEKADIETKLDNAGNLFCKGQSGYRYRYTGRSPSPTGSDPDLRGDFPEDIYTHVYSTFGLIFMLEPASFLHVL